MRRLVALSLLAISFASAQPKRILYMTHSAGFVHSSLTESAAALQIVAERSGGRLAVTHSQDVSLLRADVFAGYDAVFFFTSGELPISEAQKNELLAFVRSGKGFGGAHSATDTFYQWPEYLDLIGARFNGHPWVQEAGVDIEDPDHSATRPVSPAFRLMEEFYQFRDFSRTRSRVLMTIDVRTIDLSKPDANKGTKDFPVAWVHPYGAGRMFYTALGHFESTWQDERFRAVLLEALLWLTGQAPGDATPRPIQSPAITAQGVGNAASLQPPGRIAPGGMISVFGQHLTPGSTMSADVRNAPLKLAGVSATLDGKPLPIIFASPGQINALAPASLPVRERSTLEVTVADSAGSTEVQVTPVTPGIFVVTTQPGAITVWATGLGNSPEAAKATVNGQPATVLYSGPAPGWPGLYQMNIATSAGSGRVEIEIAGATATGDF